MNVNLIIDRLDHQGRGIGYINKKICFVEDALPGEEVEINIVKENSKIYEATVKKYIKKSDKRVTPECPYYDVCGGCNLLHLGYNDQLAYKQEKVENILSKYGNIDPSLIGKIVPSPEQFNYRNKVSLKVKNIAGFYKNKTNDIVKIDECLLASKPINKLIKKINEFGKLEHISDIVIKAMSDEEVMLIIYTDSCKDVDTFAEYMSDFVKNIIIFGNNKQVSSTNKSNIIARLGKKQYIVNPLSFFQINLAQTLNIYNKINEYVIKSKSNNLLDLYCGTGSIGIFVSDNCESLTGVEIIKEAIENAKENAKLNGVKNSSFYVGDTKLVLDKINSNFDTVIVDPPRAGLDKKVVDDIIKISPSTLVYLSCDPMTLARDLKLLSEKYEIVEVTPYDMFPNTYHVETLVLLKKK